MIETHSLEVFDASQNRIYTHAGHWLHPLFDLLDFLEAEEVDPATLSLRDKVIGRGAAVLIAHSGIRRAHGGRVSRLALPLLEAHGVSVTHDILVDQIACMTELALTPQMDLPTALAWLYARRQAALSAD